MRIFFETWCPEAIRQLAIDELASDGNLPKVNRQSAIDDLAERNFLPSIKQAYHQLSSDEIRQSPTGELGGCDLEAFLSVSFTHHIQIFSKCKTPEEKWYYIRRAATEFWSVTALKTHIRAGDYRRRGRSREKRQECRFPEWPRRDCVRPRSASAPYQAVVGRGEIQRAPYS